MVLIPAMQIPAMQFTLYCCRYCHICVQYMYIYIYIFCIYIPVVPARGGAEVALGTRYKKFHIYRTCMRRAPTKPVRARCVCEWVAVWNMTCVRPTCTANPREDSLHTSQFRLHSLALCKAHFISSQATL